MPLIQGKSKKSLQKNIETEIGHGKEPKVALGIAYSVKRKNAKKKASGGSVESGSKDMNYAEGGEVNAKNERRPMPDNRYDDAAMASRNSGNKAPKNDSWTDRPDIAQSQKGGKFALKHPKMVPQSVYSVRLRDEEDDLQQSAKTNEGPQQQPPERDNEEGPNRQGPEVRDMQDEHSTHRKPYAKGGMIDDMDHPSKHDMEPKQSGIELMEQLDEAHLMDKESPSEDEGSSDAKKRNEMSPNRQGPEVSDMEDEHSTGRRPYAGGGRISDSEANIDDDMELNPAHDKYSADDSMDQPEAEEEMEHHDSISAAIMAKRDRMHAAIDSGARDLDEAARYAEGGEILSHGSMDSDDSDQADLSRNADEDANEEDQASFQALRKENYSESEGLRQLDNPRDSAQMGDDEEDESHDRNDMVSSIRSRMNAKRQFKQR